MPGSWSIIAPGDSERRAYHWFYVWMRHSIELVELQLQFWAYVYVCAFVLRTVAVFRRRENLVMFSEALHSS